MEATVLFFVLAAVAAVFGKRGPRGRYAGRPVSEARLYHFGR